MGILGPSQTIMAAALEVRSTRADLLAGNVANADTPGYRARDLDFNRALDDRLDQLNDPQAGGAGGALVDTGRVDLQYDRNNVDVNQQLAKAFDNSLNYVATLKLYGDSAQRITTATTSS